MSRYNMLKQYIPNILSLSRLPLAFLCIYFTCVMKPWHLTISLALFMLGSFTDYLDGYLARKWKIVSWFGKIIDPIADKILILAVLFIFSYEGIIPWVLTLIIASREILMTIIRLILLSKKIVLASIQSGKIKTFTQVIVLTTIYVLLIINSIINPEILQAWIKHTILFLVLAVVGISLYSCIDFLSIHKKTIQKNLIT